MIIKSFEINKINFENLNGITGILGKNRSGKSSIGEKHAVILRVGGI